MKKLKIFAATALSIVTVKTVTELYKVKATESVVISEIHLVVERVVEFIPFGLAAAGVATIAIAMMEPAKSN